MKKNDWRNEKINENERKVRRKRTWGKREEEEEKKDVNKIRL